MVQNRYFIRISYDGTNYHGWQIQPGAITVQSTMEDALKLLLKNEISLTGAGRTDAGVHAKEFYAHFDSIIPPEELSKLNLSYKLNSILPNDIAVHEIFPVNCDSHARFDALSRTYHYYICIKKDPFWQGRAWMHYQVPEISLMQEATLKLFEFTDFSSFSKSNTQTKTNNCKIISARWVQNDHILKFEITADRFLRNMVRAITGTLVDVGLGKTTLDDFTNIIRSRNRSFAGYSAPAQGLYLVKIEYPETVFKTT